MASCVALFANTVSKSVVVANHLHGKLGSFAHWGDFIHSFEIKPRVRGRHELIALAGASLHPSDGSLGVFL